jgi:hypothetical protein
MNAATFANNTRENNRRYTVKNPRRIRVSIDWEDVLIVSEAFIWSVVRLGFGLEYVRTGTRSLNDVYLRVSSAGLHR